MSDSVKQRPDRGLVYWTGHVPEKDDFGCPIDGEFVDGRIQGRSQWALMSRHSWRMFGCGVLGTGYGQRYRRQEDGCWLKVEG